MHGNTTHGHGYGTPEYRSYWAMISRCYNHRNSSFMNYGGRGVEVCDSWLLSFEEFLRDMGTRPEGTSIERLSVDGDYTPENCCWASASEQQRNKRLQRNNRSGTTGISFDSARNRWKVCITLPDNKRYYNRFLSKEEALKFIVDKKKEILCAADFHELLEGL